MVGKNMSIKISSNSSITVNSNKQQGGTTAGIINKNNGFSVAPNFKKKKRIKWSVVLGVLASVVTILGYFGIKIKGGI